MDIDPSIRGALALAFTAPAAYVLLAVVCRMDLLSPSNSLPAWRLLYLGIGGWTGWTGAIVLDRMVLHWNDLLGVLVMALYMHATRKRWAHGVPEVAARPAAARIDREDLQRGVR